MDEFLDCLDMEDKYKTYNELLTEVQRLRDLLIEIYETDGVGMTGYMIDKVEKELGDDYFNRHVT